MTNTAVKRLIAFALALVLLPVGAAQASKPSEIRGWTLLSNNDAGDDRTIAAAKDYRINHVQLSHDVVHHLRQLKESPDRRARTNRLTDLAHRSGVKEVAVWDHAL